MSTELWESVRLCLFGPKGLFAENAEDKAKFAECEKLIDTATAELRQEIERLKAELRGKLYATGETDETKDQRIAELEAQIEAPFTGDARQSRRIRELKSQNSAMAKLLDSVPHSPADVGFSCKDTNCPACQWEKLKSASA